MRAGGVVCVCMLGGRGEGGGGREVWWYVCMWEVEEG